MKISIVSKADQLGGGASRIATELADLLLARGHIVEHWTAIDHGVSAHTLTSLYGEHCFSKQLIKFGQRVQKFLGAPDLIPFELVNNQFRKILDADIIHIHDTTTAISPISVAWLSARAPVIWTLHDCSPFTGGCLNPIGCSKYKFSCGGCPQKGFWPIHGVFDFTRLGLEQKRKLALQNKFTAVAPSKWIAEMAVASGFFPHPRIISNGINLSHFRPYPKQIARRELGIPEARLVVALCCSDLSDKRKGFEHAAKTISNAKELNPVILAIGSNSSKIRNEFRYFDFVSSGFVQDRRQLAKYYSASDVLLYCSIADNQPLTVMESMACGTPVIGFNIGGMPELINHGTNGFLAPIEVPNILHNSIKSLLSDRNLISKWSNASLIKAKSHFGDSLFVDSHLDLYSECIKSHRNSGNSVLQSRT